MIGRVGQWSMDNVTFETQDLRIRIEDNVARIDQRRSEWRALAGDRSQRVAGYGSSG